MPTPNLTDLARISAVAFAVGLLTVPAGAQSQDQTDKAATQETRAQTEGQQQPQAEQGGEQQAQQQPEQAQPQQQQAQPQQEQAQQQQAQQTTQGEGRPDDLLIVTVGQTDIRQSDVRETMETLPPQLRRVPPQMLLPVVVDQLILRSLIVEQAREEGLQSDPEVVAIVDSAASNVEDQALVDIWLQRNLAERVTEQDLREAYENIKAANPGFDRPFEEVRPQIQAQLQRQAAAAVGADLREDATIVFYGPEGNPVEGQD